MDRDDAIVGVIAIFRDVTEQVRAKTKIDEEVRRRDQFLAMLSHELRNPLGAVVTATAMLKAAGPQPAKPPHTVAILERQSQQMARLLDDLLEVSRVTQNKIDLRRRVVDLRLISAEAADAVRPQMAEKGLQFTVDLDPEPLWVFGDATRLQQIQINLLSNAVKYTPRGGLVLLRVAREDSGAVIRVSDNGNGISPHLLESIFELFVQGKHTLDHAGGGLGVGLTLVRALVEMHGGTVTARSDGEGKGSEFVVRLPLARADRASEPNPSLPPLRRSPKGTRIVIVEDNDDNRHMLCDLLTIAGFECASADDGASGLALIDETRPDIAIIDLGLPSINGFDLAERLRSEPRHADLYLIALTGYGQPADRASALRAGFDAHLVKPVNT